MERTDGSRTLVHDANTASAWRRRLKPNVSTLPENGEHRPCVWDAAADELNQ